MHVVHLHLQSFRNYATLDLTFSPGLNVLWGQNAQGKTNLLEAVFLLATGKSPRTTRDGDLVRWGDPGFLLRAQVQRRTGTLDLELTYQHDRRKNLRINGVPERRIAALVGRLAAVFFSPDDLLLIKGPPAGRRRFLDVLLCQAYPAYLHALQVYQRVLEQRNGLLRGLAATGSAPGSLLDVLDEQLVAAGAEVTARRIAAVRQLATLAASYHAALSAGREALALCYETELWDPTGPDPSPAELRPRLLALLQQRRRQELARGATAAGPHRDDLAVAIDGRDARLFASQGQQRTAVLALKLAELRFLHAELQEPPVLLLDDVASELDPGRRRHLLAAVGQGAQILLTCTDMSDLQTHLLPAGAAVFRVQAGTVQPL